MQSPFCTHALVFLEPKGIGQHPHAIDYLLKGAKPRPLTLLLREHAVCLFT